MSRPDISVLRPPISLGTSGVEQILECMETGTLEVRNALLQECEVLLECKVCRSMFRALPNFLAHKRVYCQEKYRSTKLQFVESKPEDSTVIVQPASPPSAPPCAEDMEEYVDGRDDNDVCEQNLADSEKSGTSDTNTESHSTAPKSQGGPSASDAKVFYSKTIERLQIKESEKKHCVVQLSPIRTNKNAMMQIMKDENEQKEEKQKSSSKFTAIVENETSKDSYDSDKEPPNKKIKTNETTVEPTMPKEYNNMSLRVNPKPKIRPSVKHNILSAKEKLKKIPQCSIKLLKCLRCKTTYSSVKTLYNHMVSLHSDTRTYYPCPYCKSAFTQLWGLTRHIEKNHGKTKKQIDRMRERLRKKAFMKSKKATKDTLIFHSSSEENADPIKSPSKTETHIVAPKAKGRAFVALTSGLKLYKCQQCDRSFGKKDSLKRHLPFCMRQIPSTSETTPKVNLPSSSKSSPPTVKGNADPGRSLASTSPNPCQSDLFVGISKDDVKKIQALIDEDNCLCKKCDKQYGSISYLHRHAVRHLGWRRFKCRLCKFTCYNRSECKSHLQRVHASKISGSPGLTCYILDLEPDEINTSDVQMPRVNLKDIKLTEPKQSQGQSKRTLAFKSRSPTSVAKKIEKPETESPTNNTKKANIPQNTAVPEKSSTVVLQTGEKRKCKEITEDSSLEKNKGPQTNQAKKGTSGAEEGSDTSEPVEKSLERRSRQLIIENKDGVRKGRSASSERGRAFLKHESSSTAKTKSSQKDQGTKQRNVDAGDGKGSSASQSSKKNYNMTTRNSPRQPLAKASEPDDQLQILRTRSGVKYKKPTLKEILRAKGKTLGSEESDDENSDDEGEEIPNAQDKQQENPEKPPKERNSIDKTAKVTKYPKLPEQNKGIKSPKISTDQKAKVHQEESKKQLRAAATQEKEKSSITPPRIIKSQQAKPTSQLVSATFVTEGSLTKPLTASDLIKRQRSRASSSSPSSTPPSSASSSPQRTLTISPRATRILPAGSPTKTFDLSKAKFILSPLVAPGSPNQQINFSQSVLSGTGSLITSTVVQSPVPLGQADVGGSSSPSTSGQAAGSTSSSPTKSPGKKPPGSPAMSANLPRLAPKPQQKDFIVLVDNPTGVNKVVEAMTKAAQMGTKISSDCMYMLKDDILTPVSRSDQPMTGSVIALTTTPAPKQVLTTAGGSGYATRSVSSMGAVQVVATKLQATASPEPTVTKPSFAPSNNSMASTSTKTTSSNDKGK